MPFFATAILSNALTFLKAPEQMMTKKSCKKNLYMVLLPVALYTSARKIDLNSRSETSFKKESIVQHPGKECGNILS